MELFSNRKIKRRALKKAATPVTATSQTTISPLKRPKFRPTRSIISPHVQTPYKAVKRPTIAPNAQYEAIYSHRGITPAVSK